MWLKLSRRPPPFSATENESRKTVTENSLRRLYIHGALLTTRGEKAQEKKTEIFKDKRMSSNATIWFLSSAQAAFILFMLPHIGNVELRQVGPSLGTDSLSRRQTFLSLSLSRVFELSSSRNLHAVDGEQNIATVIKAFHCYLRTKILNNFYIILQFINSNCKILDFVFL